ncbi:MAG: hypothetical protein F6K23_20410 [Okeania sp. SIO2C9]|uniref:hypothetical protein n=1 Tax=Okeania sp. SIO2C9 TaxID=2607791 RepID=UPI0013C18DA2|nr:hypothetical protein [Okeania sp. SIO2C9]NEQ75197.1 hypothetical protein [Okeania sp. SIO2C9]
MFVWLKYFLTSQAIDRLKICDNKKEGKSNFTSMKIPNQSQAIIEQSKITEYLPRNCGLKPRILRGFFFL